MDKRKEADLGKSAYEVHKCIIFLQRPHQQSRRSTWLLS